MQVLDKGFVELLDVMGDDLAIVNAARVSYLGESKGAVQDKKLLFYLMEHWHTTPFEMVEFKFRVKAPLFVVAQWFRHRTFSFNSLSARYSEMSDEFYVPNEWRKQAKKNKQGSEGRLKGFLIDKCYRFYLWFAYKVYKWLLKKGVARELARMVLPPSLYTTFIAKVDAHNLMGFLKLRMDEHAQWEIQQYANAIYDMFKEKLPWTAEAFEKYRL